MEVVVLVVQEAMEVMVATAELVEVGVLRARGRMVVMVEMVRTVPRADLVTAVLVGKQRL